MQKIHNIIFYSIVVSLVLSVILLTFGNSKVGGTLILISIALSVVEQLMLKKVLSKKSKRTQIQEVENSYTPPSRMDFLESNLGNDLIGKQEGLDEAVMGFDYHSMRLIYSIQKVIDILKDKNNWSFEEAEEFVYKNMVGSLGNDEPIWLECSISIEL